VAVATALSTLPHGRDAFGGSGQIFARIAFKVKIRGDGR
jgi:hypothetical protein